jgi:glucosamine--fructose-6-phosphate aminotransferase (isomerizing)
MCGIIGIIGDRDAAPLLMGALRRLEYRGYDSAGVATVHGGALDRRRAVGKLDALAEVLARTPIIGTVGIGHTRWATHGAPTEANAHPHAAARVVVVHNGIIENFRDLRAELTARGHHFATQTDTETIVHLCEDHLSAGLAPADAAAATLGRLRGAFALCFLFAGEDDLLVAARRGSPLVIGYGEGEMFVGSDALALASLTSSITYLEEGDRAILTRAGADIRDETGAPVVRARKRVDVSSIMVEKGEHKHFMAKEIHEQPTVVAYALGHHLDAARARVTGSASEIDFDGIDRIVMIACGTGHYACAVAKHWFEDIARIPVEVDVASEFRYRNPPLSDRTCAIFVSQSGETADTLAALRHAAPLVRQVISVVNVAESSIARGSNVALPILAGPEIGVASTKAFTCSLITLACLAIAAGRARGTIDAAREAHLVGLLCETPRLLAEALSAAPQIERAARLIASARDVLYLGRGTMHAMALEGALKLKEISYIHAEGYAAGEMKHGPIALVDPAVPVVVLAPSDPVFEKTVSNMQEVMARGGRVVLITDEAGARLGGEGAADVVIMPTCDPLIAPIIMAVAVQLLAYFVASALGKDVDQPRNLAKSVTVE